MLTSRKFNFCIWTLVSILVLSSFAAAQDDSVRKELEAIYAKRDQAMKAKDANFQKSLLADDYAQKEEDGTIRSRADTISTIDKNASDPDLSDVSVVTKIESVKQGKDASELIVETSLNIKMTGKMNGQTHQLQINGKSRDTWVRNDAGWKLKLSEEHDSTMTEVETAWINYTSPEGRYAVSLPNKPKVDTRENPGKPKSHLAMSTSLPAVFWVTYFDLGPDETFVINDWLKGEMNDGSTIIASNSINVGGFPGNQLIRLEKSPTGENITDTRITKVEGRIYLIIFGYAKEAESDAVKAKATKFFDSFKITGK